MRQLQWAESHGAAPRPPPPPGPGAALGRPGVPGPIREGQGARGRASALWARGICFANRPEAAAHLCGDTEVSAQAARDAVQVQRGRRNHHLHVREDLTGVESSHPRLRKNIGGKIDPRVTREPKRIPLRSQTCTRALAVPAPRQVRSGRIDGRIAGATAGDQASEASLGRAGGGRSPPPQRPCRCTSSCRPRRTCAPGRRC